MRVNRCMVKQKSYDQARDMTWSAVYESVYTNLLRFCDLPAINRSDKK